MTATATGSSYWLPRIPPAKSGRRSHFCNKELRNVPKTRLYSYPTLIEDTQEGGEFG